MSGKGYSNKKGHYHRHGYRNIKSKPIVIGEKGQENWESIDENSAVIQMFREYAKEIDTKHDRYERIVKLSRDITIESKRIIFLLHNIDRKTKKDEILIEAGDRLKNLSNTLFKTIACELENTDPYQYFRAYAGGLQEYIEALTFYQYLNAKSIDQFSNVEERFTYSVPSGEEHTKTKNANVEQSSSSIIPIETRDIKTLIPFSEFILGLADLTGELMRKCINNLGSGNIEDCFQTCEFVRNIYKGFLGISNAQGCKEIARKSYVLKQSLMKMELVCYNIIVRGSEVPQEMLVDVVTLPSQNPTEEEIFY